MRLREIRKHQKVSATELAKLLGVSFQHYYAIERGEKQLSAEQLAKLSLALNVKMDELWGRDPSEAPANQEETATNEPFLKNNFGARLKRARIEKNVTQKEVHRVTGINNKTLSGYEQGIAKPPYETLIALAEIYEVSLNYLLGREERPSTKNEPFKTELLKECEKLSPTQQRHVLAIIKTFTALTAQRIAAEEKPKNRHSLTK